MKRLIKILTVASMIGILCVLFAGCDELDQMQSRHALLSENRETISFKDKTFYKLPDGVPYFFNDTYSNRITVTEADVPVLLSEEFGYEGYYDALNDILAVTNFNSFNNISTYSSIYYYPEEIQCTYYTQQDNLEKYSQLTMEDADRIGFYGPDADYETTILGSNASDEILTLIKDNSAWDTDIYEDIMMNSRESIPTLYQCNKTLTLKGTLNGYELNIMQIREIYLTNYYNGSAVKLSDSTVEEILEKYYDYSLE